MIWMGEKMGLELGTSTELEPVGEVLFTMSGVVADAHAKRTLRVLFWLLRSKTCIV